MMSVCSVFSYLSDPLCLHHQTGYDIQQAQEDSSRPAVPADPGVREDEGLSSHGAGAEFRWEPSAL